MPRTPKKPPAVIPTTSLVASAVRYPGKAARIYEGQTEWQSEAYRHYRICGEARYAANFFANALSRATLHAALATDEGDLEPQYTGTAADILADLFKGKAGQAQMLKAIGLHHTIAGECYLVGREVTEAELAESGEQPTGPTSTDVWEIVSVQEMSVTGSTWQIRRGANRQPVVLKDTDVVIRIWNPDPADSMAADSPFRSLLPVLTEIEYLTRHIFAQCTSRLAGAGLLFLPQGMSFPPPVDADGKALEYKNAADGFMMMLADAMLTPIEDPSSPSALIPPVVTVPDDVVDKATLMHFWSELDGKALEMRQDAIRRFALGMDLPPEQVTGMSSNSGTGGGNSNGVSHWGAWQIEEATIKMHLEPTLDLVCNALTVAYMRPLNKNGNEQVAYSTEKLRLRPDRSKESIILGNLGLLKGSVLVTENGFDVADMPDEEESRMWLIRKIATGSATPEQVQAALTLLGVQLPTIEAPDNTTPRETRPDPSLEDHPSQPRTPEPSALLYACDALVYRALERAGNRIRTAENVSPKAPAHATHTVVAANGKSDWYLQDAFSCAPQVLDGLADVDATIKVLDGYCRTLFKEKAEHSRARLAEWLEIR